MSQRNKGGSIALDSRSRVWNFFYWEDGKRRCKQIGRFPNKTAAWRAAKPLRDAVESETIDKNAKAVLVKDLIVHYRIERMPSRSDTRRSYEMWFKNHIIPKWGEGLLAAVQARPVDLWLQSLDLSPKSKSHIRSLLSTLWNYAMWRGDLPNQRNPIELVTVKGATKRTRKPRSLTVEEFRKFVAALREPFKTVALVCVAFGLRISEALALKWHDVDWLNRRLRVERGIVCQIVDDVKTDTSDSTMSIASEVLAVLTGWKLATQFSGGGELGIRVTDQSWPAAIFLHRSAACFPESSTTGRDRRDRDAYHAPHLQGLA